jgi:hypothetical protein
MQQILLYVIMSFAILGLGFLTGVPTYGKENESLDAQVTVPNNTEISVSPLYHSNIGKVTSIKILNVTGFPRTEVSFTENGTMVDIGNVTNIGTFLETNKSDKSISGQGKGIIATTDGDLVMWTSYDLGQINSDKSEKYRGIIFFDAVSRGKLDFLNNTVGLYTSDVGSNGSSLRQIWQWK